MITVPTYVILYSQHLFHVHRKQAGRDTISQGRKKRKDWLSGRMLQMHRTQQPRAELSLLFGEWKEFERVKLHHALVGETEKKK
jgi:hypothetical protein